jgi:hypothetical protein
VVAGEYTTVRFVYTAGVPIDDTGCIRLLHDGEICIYRRRTD